MKIKNYGGLGDRHQQNNVNYTLDLNTGLTQVLSDGTNTYLYGNGRISQHSTQTEYFLGDALGSVRQLADTAGAVTLTQSYSPYGETISSVGTSSSVYQFTGESRDANGLTYLRARYLNNSTGRFTQRDPSGLEANLYLYAGANPVMNVDPSGYWYEMEEDFSLWAIWEPGDTWFTLFDFLGIKFTGYRGNLGEVPKRYFLDGPEPVVIIACGKDIICSPGNTASLDLYENWGDEVKRMSATPFETGVKWRMASKIQTYVGGYYKTPKRGPFFIVGHSAGGDAVTAYISMMTEREKNRIGGVVIIDPTLSAGWDINDESCPEAKDYPSVGSMAKILDNRGLGSNKLIIYDSDKDGIILKPFLNSNTDKYKYEFETGLNHLEMAGNGWEGQRVYNFSAGILKPSQWR